MLEPKERLRNAVIQGNLPLTKRLLSRFPELWLNVDPSYKGWSNLHFASYHGNYLICFHLISYINNNLDSIKSSYSQLDLLTFDRLSVLHLALINHHSQTLHYLLQEFPGQFWLNFPGGNLEQTPLHYACIHGFEDGVKLLLEFGGDWNVQDTEGNTCLHYCFQYGRHLCIKSLFRFILQQHEKEEAISMIKKFEAVKNKKGWNAIDVASTFELIKTYQSLKDNLFANNYFKKNLSAIDWDSNSFNLEHNNGSEVTIPENKVLSSQIVSMSQQSDSQDSLVQRSNNVEGQGKNKNIKGRAHSQSLPDSTEPISNKSVNSNTRKRSQTTYNNKVPNLMLYNLNSPRTPTFSNAAQFAPLNHSSSLKSVTISPSVRNNSTTRSDLPPSPQSSYSTSSMNYSPSNNVKKLEVVPLNLFTSSKTDAEKWPSLNITPIKDLNAAAQNNIPKYETYTDAGTFQSYYMQPFMFTSSSPSPQRQTNTSKMRSRSSSSSSSIAVKIPNSSSKSSLDENGIKVPNTHLRKIMSTTVIKPNPVEVRPLRSSSISAISSSQTSDTTSPKKSSVNNVSFSRVR